MSFLDIFKNLFGKKDASPDTAGEAQNPPQVEQEPGQFSSPQNPATSPPPPVQEPTESPPDKPSV